MADPQQVLGVRVRAALSAAFGADFADADPLIRPSSFADFQSNAALPLANTYSWLGDGNEFTPSWVGDGNEFTPSCVGDGNEPIYSAQCRNRAKCAWTQVRQRLNRPSRPHRGGS